MANGKGKYQQWLTPEGLIRLRGWAMDGLDDEQIARDKVGVSRQKLYNWRKKYEEIDEALRMGKDVADRQVENALFKAALEGNVTAIIFWLKNRKPDKWRDMKNIDANIESIKKLDQILGDIDGIMDD